ncbi:hypothetical protein BKI52_12085 [marine bacterium AO1-C]|nr:hypothetical protein BKI52_12085 [marine bacterium AO1-C]
MRILYSTLVLLFFLTTASAQKKIDSLKNIIDQALQDTNQVKTLYAYADAFRLKNAIDFKRYIDQGLTLAEKLDFQQGLAEGYRRTGTYYRMQSNYEEGAVYFLKALKIFERLKNQMGIAKCYDHLGLIYQRQMLRAAKQEKEVHYRKSEEYYQKVTKIYERINYPKGVAINYMSMAELNTYNQQFEKAQKLYDKGITLALKESLVEVEADLYLSKADMFIMWKKSEKAIDFLNKSIAKFSEVGNQMKLILSYMSIGRIYGSKKLYNKALEYYTQALSLSRKIQSKYHLISGLIHIATVKIALKDFDGARAPLKESIDLSRQVNNMNTLLNAYRQKIALDLALKNYQQAFEDQSIYYRIKDSVFSARKSKQLTEMLTKFDSQKKESENALLRKDNLLQKETIKQQNLITGAIGVILVLTVVFAVIFLRASQKLRKQRNEMQQQNKLLETQKLEISTQNELLTDQKAQILAQNEELQQQGEELMANKEFLEVKHDALVKTTEVLEQKNIQIKQSIKAGLTIQRAILPSPTRLKRHLSEYFVLYRPKDVVSGDFYWFSVAGTSSLEVVDNHTKTNENSKLILAAVDCTGHGVPGAFMSMIGFILLDRIVEVEHISDPASILERLNKLIRLVLNQGENTASSGMDIGLITLESKQNESTEQIKVTFAGARRPLYYIQDPENNNAVVQELRGQRNLIGTDAGLNEPFENQEVWLKKGDLIYLTSDGLVDQNDQKRRKFQKKRLMKLLNESTHLSLEKQQGVLEQALDEHMQATTQRDDILVWGIKV